MSKPDQDWSTETYGRYHDENWYLGSLYYTYDGNSVLSQQSKKLKRSATQPESRAEKPYATKTSTVIFPVGGIVFGYSDGGTSFIYKSGNLGNFSASGGFNTQMTWTDYRGIVKTPSVGDWPFDPDLLSQAEVKAYSALRNKYHEKDLSSYITPGIWYGERKETAQLLSDAATGLLKLVRGVKDLNFGKVRRAIADFGVDLNANMMKRIRREISIARRKVRRQSGEVLLGLTAKDTFFTANRVVLTANLGVSPLLRDLDAAYMATLQSAVDPSSLNIKAHGFVQKQQNGVSKKEFYGGKLVEKTSLAHVDEHRVTFVAKPADSFLAIVERAGGLNTPSTLAELTGLSFIVNYFYPVLDYLKAVSTPAAFEWKDGSWGFSVSHVQLHEYRSVSPLGPKVARGSFVHKEFRRMVYSTFPVPIPPLSLRQQELDVDQAVNVITVAIEKIRKAVGL